MLARKYEYEYEYGYSYSRKQEEREEQKREERKLEKQNNAVIRRQVLLLIAVCMLSYFLIVAMSEYYVTRTNSLVKLKREEAILLGENQSLKIDVDKLKSPERITELASSKLGLSTARSNIYMHAAKGKGDSKSTDLQLAQR